MVPNGSKLFQIVSNGSKWLQMVPDGSQWFQIVANGCKWLQMVPNGSNLSQKVPKALNFLNGSKWFLKSNHDTHLWPCFIDGYSLMINISQKESN